MALPFVDRSSSSLPIQIVGQSSWRKWLKEQSAARRAAGSDRRASPARRAISPCCRAATARPPVQCLCCRPSPVSGISARSPPGCRPAPGGSRPTPHRCRRPMPPWRSGSAPGASNAIGRTRARQGAKIDVAAGRRQGARHGDDRGDLDGARSHHHAVVRHGAGRARGRCAGPRQGAQGQDQGDRGRRCWFIRCCG